MKKYLFYYFIGILLILGSIYLYVYQWWWMIFTVIIMFFVVMWTSSFFVINVDDTIYDVIRKYKEQGIEDIPSQLRKYSKIALCLLSIEIILALYPFILMSSSLATYVNEKFHIFYIEYEGGIIVSLIVILSETYLIYDFIQHVKFIKGKGVNSIIKRIENDEKEKEWQIEKECAKKLGREKKQIEFQKLLSSLQPLDKNISVNGNIIAVNEKQQKILIKDKIYTFKEILAFHLDDNIKTQTTSLEGETKSKLGSVVGRSIAGGVIAGGVGAIIGGSTAKKKTELQQNIVSEIHDYTVIVTVDNISDSLKTIYIGNDVNKANEIVSLFTVIINMNKNSSN